MGLDIMCGPHAISIGYGGFNALRTIIWRHISGMELNDMEGFSNHPGGIPFPNKYKLEYFIDHSDCEGEISPDQAIAMLPELKKLIEDAKELSEKDPTHLLAIRLDYLLKLHQIFEQSGLSDLPIEFG